jgi:uncharacterized delta-60 repeat protein
MAVAFGSPYTAAIQADGKVLLCGPSSYVYPGLQADFKIVRLNSDGSLDNTFGSGGVVLTNLGYAADVPNTINIQHDGKIVVAGTVSKDINYDGAFALVRYNADGSLDETFGNFGKLFMGFTFRVLGTAMTIDSAGKILMAGTAYTNGSDGDIALVRFTGEGKLDNAFGQSGLLIIAQENTNEAASGLAIDGHGRIIVAGTSSMGGNSVYFVMRCTDAGVLDTDFNNTGIVRAPFNNVSNKINALLVQKDDKIILGGSEFGFRPEDGQFSRFAVWRFNPNGQLDAAFNGSGQNTRPFRKNQNDFISALTLKREWYVDCCRSDF